MTDLVMKNKLPDPSNNQKALDLNKGEGFEHKFLDISQMMQKWTMQESQSPKTGDLEDSSPHRSSTSKSSTSLQSGEFTVPAHAANHITSSVLPEKPKAKSDGKTTAGHVHRIKQGCEEEWMTWINWDFCE